MKILVIDAYNMIHRARFGFAQGDHAITFNFFRALKSEIVRHEADKVFVVSEGRPIHRLELNADYKGQRVPVKDENFHRQKREIFRLCQFLPVTVSSDSDFIQLLDSDDTKLWNPVKKKFIDQWPVDYVTWKALKGDATDNVPGIKGIGEKRAFALCEGETSLHEFLLADESRKSTFESAYAQIRLADIDKSCPSWEIENYSFDEKNVFKAFTDRGFKSIIGKSWHGWKTTMEKLNNDTYEHNINR